MHDSKPELMIDGDVVFSLYKKLSENIHTLKVFNRLLAKI